MSRIESNNLTEILKSYTRRDTLLLYLNDQTTLPLSRGAVVRDGVTYKNYIRSVGDLSASFDRAVDNIEITCQNVNSELGYNLASNLRLLDYALADYGRIYQSTRNPALIEDFPRMFAGVIANAQADEQNFKVQLIVDFESMGSIIATRGLSPKCSTTLKNGIECTTTAFGLSCPRTLLACKKYGKPWENMGWEYFEEPLNAPPGTGGGGGIGGCFIAETKVWLPSGDLPIGDLPIGRPSERIAVVSFDPLTNAIDYDDEIEEVWEEEINGYFTFEFKNTIIPGVSARHRFLRKFGLFQAADLFQLGGSTRIFADDWADSKLIKIKWNSDARVKMRNLRVKKNHTFFANRCAVSNAKQPEDI